MYLLLVECLDLFDRLEIFERFERFDLADISCFLAVVTFDAFDLPVSCGVLELLFISVFLSVSNLPEGGTEIFAEGDEGKFS